MSECHEDSYGCSRSETYLMAPMLLDVTRVVCYVRLGILLFHCSVTDDKQNDLGPNGRRGGRTWIDTYATCSDTASPGLSCRSLLHKIRHVEHDVGMHVELLEVDIHGLGRVVVVLMILPRWVHILTSTTTTTTTSTTATTSTTTSNYYCDCYYYYSY